MFSKLKVFFLVATCSLSLGLGFLLPALSNQKTAFAESDSSSSVSSTPPVFDADEYVKSWSSGQKQKVMSRIASYPYLFFIFFFSKSPGIVAIDPKTRKDAIYKFDKVVSAFKEWANKQKKSVYNFNFQWNTFLSSSFAQNQILQLYKKDGGVKTGGITTKWLTQYKKIIADVWNTIQPLVYQMNILGIKQYKDFYRRALIFDSPVEHNVWDYSKKDYTYEQLKAERAKFKTYYLIKELISMTSLSFAKKTFTAALDKDWLPKLQLLQSAPGLASLRVGEKDVDVFSLTSSNAQSIADLNKDQTDTLAKFKDTTLEKLQELVAPHIKLLTNYKNTIQTSLQKLASAKVNQLTINSKTYDMDQLLTKVNLVKLASELPEDAKTQLLNLVKVKITKSQLDTALNQILTAREAQVQKEKAAAAKKAQDKKTTLTIGLATSGGVLLLAGGAGGFLYWFYKIKK